MKNYSATIAGLIVIVFGFLGIADVLPGDARLEDIINAVIQLVGIIVAAYGRFRQGDINILGVKK